MIAAFDIAPLYVVPSSRHPAIIALSSSEN
jgi:hypothetical protein